MSATAAGGIVPAKHRARRARIAAVCLAIAAVAFVLLPFNASLSGGGAGSFRFGCRAPIVSAWSRGPHRLALWAVTVGTNMQGYEVNGGQAPWCGDRARQRVALSAGLVVIAAGLTIYDIRARRRSAIGVPVTE